MRNSILVAGFIVGAAAAPQPNGHADHGNMMSTFEPPMSMDGNMMTGNMMTGDMMAHPCSMFPNGHDETCFAIIASCTSDDMAAMVECVQNSCIRAVDEAVMMGEPIDEGETSESICQSFMMEMHMYHNNEPSMHPCSMFEGHEATCKGVLDMCHTQHETDQNMMANCVFQGCVMAVNESGDDLEGKTADEICGVFMDKLGEFYGISNGDDSHYENMHPCGMFEGHEGTCQSVVDMCKMNHEFDEMMMATCVKTGCVDAIDAAVMAGEPMDPNMTSDQICDMFMMNLEAYHSADEHHEDGHHDDIHPCSMNGDDADGFEATCYGVLEMCHMENETDENMMAKCIFDKCVVAANESVEDLEGATAEEACGSFMFKLDEYYNGEHPCGMFEGHEHTCKNVVQECHMNHMDDEAMMVSCISTGCITAVNESGEDLEGNTAEDLCSMFLMKLDEHYNGNDEDHHEDHETLHHEDHPCSMIDYGMADMDNAIKNTCHSAVEACMMMTVETMDTTVICLRDTCTAIDAVLMMSESFETENEEHVCEMFIDIAQAYFGTNDGHNEEDEEDEEHTTPMNLNKHHPCTIMREDHHQGCVENYENSKMSCENDNNKNCMKKACQSSINKAMKNEMLHMESGDEVTDKKVFCKAFLKQEKKFLKKEDACSTKDAEDIEKMNKHHPCMMMSDDMRVCGWVSDCASGYEKMYEKCWMKDSSEKKMKKCMKKECGKAMAKAGVEDSDDICKDMEKQSRKYQSKMVTEA